MIIGLSLVIEKEINEMNWMSSDSWKSHSRRLGYQSVHLSSGDDRAARVG